MQTLIGPKQLQRYMATRQYYKGMIDGILGQKSLNSAADFILDYTNEHQISKPIGDAELIFNALTQILFTDLGLYSDAIDGFVGPNTEYALEQYQNLMVGSEPPANQAPDNPTTWPTYNNMTRFYGKVGTNIALYDLPYSMQLAWDTDTTVTRISLNKKCGESAMRVFGEVLKHYGSAKVADLGLNLFGGSLNVRKMRGGDKWSTHSWAAAIDFDPLRNKFRWNSRKASFAASDYAAWWNIWEAEGWVSLGRERNFDWMHVQAVRL